MFVFGFELDIALYFFSPDEGFGEFVSYSDQRVEGNELGLGAHSGRSELEQSVLVL